MKSLLAAGLIGAASFVVHAGPVDTLRDFVREAKTGRATFTQTVTSPDGSRKKVSSGVFEFSRPNHFRFEYQKPFAQLIVADGQKVWIYDADLNQASSRKFSQALGATPAALLAGGALDADFDLSALPARDGLEWAQAQPKAQGGAFQSVRIGFKGKEVAVVEITDSFGQRSALQLANFTTNLILPADRFRFVPPKGADVIEQ